MDGLPLSRSSVRRLRRTLGLPATRRRRGRQVRTRRTPEAQMGALVQLDASFFAWLEDRGPVLALHGAIDDATGTGLALVFRPAEDLHGYGTLFHTICTTYGLPLALYGDRLGVFVRNDAHWTLAEELRGTQDPTHFGRIRQALGIGYIAARSPQAKGRIERFWQTLQDASSASCACAASAPWRRPTPSCRSSSPTSTRASRGPPPTRGPLGRADRVARSCRVHVRPPRCPARR